MYCLFLQAAISRKIMSERLIKLLWKKCTEAVAGISSAFLAQCEWCHSRSQVVAAPELDFKFVDTSEKWDSFIKNINDRLDSLGLELKSTIDESNGTKLYIIVCSFNYRSSYLSKCGIGKYKRR